MNGTADFSGLNGPGLFQIAGGTVTFGQNANGSIALPTWVTSIEVTCTSQANYALSTAWHDQRLAA